MTVRHNQLLHVGRSIPGYESRAKITGTAVYTTDLAIEGMLHGRILRSPHAHARIRSIDTSAAERVPGVVAVVSGADLAGFDGFYGNYIRDQPVLAVDVVRYAGEPVVAIAAEDEALACRALELVRIEYDLLPPILDIESALAVGAPALFDRQHGSALYPPPLNSTQVQEPSPNILYVCDYAIGDIDQAFRDCARIFENRFTFARLSHYGLEPHACIARADSETIEVWANNQDPFILREDMARIFRLPSERLRIHAGLVGGGFGAKSFCKTEPIAVLLAMKARQPVRLMLTMTESMLTVCEHGAEFILRTGVSASGETVARETLVHLDGGAYADASPAVASRICTRFASAYRWRAVKTKVSVVRTTTVPAGSFRGFGASHVAWASDSQIDLIARAIGEDPCEFRMKNFVSVGTSNVPGECSLDSDLVAGLDAVKERIGYGKPRPKGRGVGVAVTIKSSGGFHRADATVRVLCSGRAIIATGVTEIGQSTTTVMSQIAAEVLCIPPDLITVDSADTAVTPFDTGTHSSCGLTVSGLAIRDASERARDAVLAFAAQVLQCGSTELSFVDFEVVQGNSRHSLSDLAVRARLSPEAEFRGDGSTLTPNRSFFWMPSWTAAEVEVDEETGRVRVLSLVGAVDVGKAINPQRCLSQLEGGAIQGLGQTLFEHLRYEGESPANAHPFRYRVPRISDIPRHFEGIVLEQGLGPGPYGSKGVGEAGNLTVAAAVANAIADATGARVTELPLTPEKILRALDDVPSDEYCLALQRSSPGIESDT